MNLTDLSPADLRRAAQIKEQIDSLTSELSSILSGASNSSPAQGGSRQMSAAGRARIAAAARARWARVKAGKGGTPSNSGGRRKRTMSPAARAKIAAAAKARWAKAKAAGKSRL